MNKQTIKMLAVNPTTKKLEEVFPESEVELSEMQPRFLTMTVNGYKWMSVPGITAEEIYNEWIEQVRG